MADSWMPDVQVDIAFTSTFATPAASRTWTDVSAYAELHEGIDITVGRQDERSTADANQITLTLDNTDGRFTAGRAASPYFPNVKIGRPIRVRVTPPGGSTVTRFVGFIDEWPVEWDGTDRYASATIRATSRMSRLGLTAKMRSIIEQEILLDRPAQYYTLGEPQGATQANDSSGNGNPPATVFPGEAGPGPTFGAATGPAFDELPAPIFIYSNGTSLTTAPTYPLPPTAWSIEIFFSTSVVGSLSMFALKDPRYSTLSPELLISAAGKLIGRVNGSGSIVSAASVNDGLTHHAALTCSGTTLTLYLDGSPLGTAAAAGTPVFPVFAIGPFEGALSHAASFASALSASRIAAHAAAGLTGTVGERTDQRLVRILNWAGVASSEITTETGQQTMTYQKTSGQSVVDAIREVESTEFGVLYDRPDGNVGFHNRAHRYLSTAAATLNMAAQHVGADYSPKLDRSALINDVTVSNPTTDQSARSMDTSSADEYGIATASSTVTSDTYDPLQQRAAWLIASYSTPRTRVPSLTVDVLAHQGLTPSAQTLLGVTVGDLLAVTNAPTQADTTSPSYFVEGYTESIGPESYEISFNLSPTYPTLNTFVLDSATRGQLDAGNVLAL